MTEIEYRGQYPLDVTVVPARAAYLVRKGSRDGFRRAVQEASTRWAGMTELIIPVHEDGTVPADARSTVELARVDGAVNVDLPDDHARAAAAALGLECTNIEHIDQFGITMFTCHPSSVGPATPPGEGMVIARSAADLWQAVAAGDLLEEHHAAFESTELSVRRSYGPDDVGRAQLSGTTLLRRTLAEFGETYGSEAPLPGPMVVWITEPDDLEDCWAFWNARALAPVRYGPMPMILLPCNEIHNWLQFDSWFEQFLARPAGFTPDVVVISRNIPAGALDEFAGLLHLQRSDAEIKGGHRFPAVLRTPPFTYRVAAMRDIGPRLSFARTYGTTTQVDLHVFDSGTTARFASPIKFQGGSMLMRFGGTPFRGLPRRPAIAKLVAPEESAVIWRENAIQVPMWARNEHTFPLQVPSLQEAVYALLEDATIGYQLSNDGKLATGINRNIDLSILRQPGLFRVIKRLTTSRFDHLLGKVKKKFKGDNQIDEIIDAFKPLVEEWGARIERKIVNAHNLHAGATSANVAALEQLCDLGWAERGLAIKCTECRVETFIPLSDVAPRNTAACPGCGSHQNYVSGSREISIFYRLDSLVDRASDQGVISHLITIGELCRQESQSWFIPGVDVWFADRKDKLEADIFGAYGGRVAVGEVKTSGSEFTNHEIAKQVDRCVRLRADVCIMSAMDAIADEARSTAEHLCAKADLDLLVLTGDDLMPGWKQEMIVDDVIVFYRARLDEEEQQDTTAKRKLLDDYECRCREEQAVSTPALQSECTLLRSVIRRLASTYSDHPDYRDEFRP